MSNARQLAANLPREGGLSNRNMVINGDLSVWQRGTSFSNTSSTSYTADRWFAYRGTVTRQSNADDGGYSLRWTYSSSNSTTTNFISQMIEDVNCKHTRGQYVTLSFEVKANSTWGAADFGFDVIETSTLNPNPNGISQSITNKVAVTADWQRVTKTFGPIAATTTNLCITFGRDNTTVVDGEWFEVRKVQLEVGTATPFEHRSYSDQLQACQRYYQYYPYVGEGTPLGIVHGYTFTNAVYKWATKILPVPMRAKPSITLESGSGTNLDNKARYVTTSGGHGGQDLPVYGVGAFNEGWDGISGSRNVNGFTSIVIKSYNEQPSTCYGFQAGFAADAEL